MHKQTGLTYMENSQSNITTDAPKLRQLGAVDDAIMIAQNYVHKCKIQSETLRSRVSCSGHDWRVWQYTQTRRNALTRR